MSSRNNRLNKPLFKKRSPKPPKIVTVPVKTAAFVTPAVRCNAARLNEIVKELVNHKVPAGQALTGGIEEYGVCFRAYWRNDFFTVEFCTPEEATAAQAAKKEGEPLPSLANLTNVALDYDMEDGLLEGEPITGQLHIRRFGKE